MANDAITNTLADPLAQIRAINHSAAFNRWCGIEVALELKGSSEAHNTKIIFLSGLEDPWPAFQGSKQEVSKELGMEDFFVKTKDLTELVKRVQAIVREGTLLSSQPPSPSPAVPSLNSGPSAQSPAFPSTSSGPTASPSTSPSSPPPQ